MAIVRAGPNQFLLVGRHGTLENRGSAVQAFLRPGTIYLLVPSTKQEAAFEFTQETKDGIPLRFKGTVIYRIADPVAAARQFDFSVGSGISQITTLLTHVCLGELRHAVSHMTMVECIEQRKTTLSGVVEAHCGRRSSAGDGGDAWGIEVEVAQVAQVFIVDTALRQQLEAEVRNEIKVRSDQSDIRSQQEIRLAELAAEGEVQERRLASDQQALRHAQERFRSEMAVEQDRVDTETPVRLQRIAREREVLEQELVLRRLQAEVQALDVERDLLLPRAQQDLRREILPLEQAPRIVEAAARVFHGTNLSIYGDGGQLLEGLAPVFDLLARSIGQATRATSSLPKSRRRRAPRRRSREDRGRSDDLHLDLLEGRLKQVAEHRLAVGEVVEGAMPIEGAQDTPGEPGMRT